MKFLKKAILPLLLSLLFTLTACSSGLSTSSASGSPLSQSSQPQSGVFSTEQSEASGAPSSATVPSSKVLIKPSGEKSISIKSLPVFQNKPYVALNGNKPDFQASDFTTRAFENYSNLDSLGRCGIAFANVCRETMPTKERGSIGMIKPTGWHTVKYDFVDGKYLYNRCHLIGYQLTAENANPKNLITGTRYLNVEGMLPFENMVADYIKETHNHVLYRVSPIFEGNNLVAAGVQMEAESVEDKGKGISYNVFCYNSQPGVQIDYATGISKATGGSAGSSSKTSEKSSGKASSKVNSVQKSETSNVQTYVLNTSTKKFHKPDCSEVKKMKSTNKKTYKGSRSTLISEGYSPCKICNP